MNTSLPIFNKIYQAIQKANRILLVSDSSPDGDSIGTTAAFYQWLQREGKIVRAFCANPLPRNLLFVDHAQAFTTNGDIFKESYDLIITFDSGSLRRAGIDQFIPSTPPGYTLIVFDHHATNERFGTLNAVFTDACSTAEVVYRFFEELRITIDDRMATALLTGIVYDTSSFSNSGTTSKGVEAAGHLFARGARQTDVLKYLVQNKSIDGLKLWGLALSRLHYHTDFDMVSTYFFAKELPTKASEESVEGMSNFLNAVCGYADAVLVLRELPDGRIRGSMRSLKRDISKVAQLLGGGGHKKAAGFTVNGKLKEENGSVRVVEA